MNVNIQEYLLENLFDGIYYADKNRIITYWNRSAENITGYKREEVLGKSCADGILKHIDINGNNLCKTKCPLHDAIHNGKTQDAELFLHHKDGHRVPVSVRVSPVKDESGMIVGAVEIFSDKSERADMIRHFEKIQQQTFVDPVSKVGNKKYAMFHLNRKFLDMKMHKVLFGIILISVDNFLKVKDDYGQHVADAALEMVAKTSKNCLKSMDIVARWDNDEFIVITPNINEIKKLAELGERIRIFVENSWLHVGHKILQVTVSVGATLSERNDTHESIIGRADKLTEKAQQSGGNRCEYV